MKSVRDWRSQARLVTDLSAGRRPFRPREWGRYHERLAVLITDMSGFTSLLGRYGPERLVALIYWMRRLAQAVFRTTGGEFVKCEADDLFAVFPDAAKALRCALALHAAFRQPVGYLDHRVSLSMGIGMGDVLWWGPKDIYGLEVNLASKLGEDTAGPEETLLTAAAAADVRRRIRGVKLAKAGAVAVGRLKYPYLRYVDGAR